MALSKAKLKELLQLVVKDKPHLSTDGEVLMCVPCNKPITFKDTVHGASNIASHNTGSKHIAKLAKWDSSASHQDYVKASLENHRSNKQAEFNSRLAKVFIKCKIPLHTLENMEMVDFLRDYTKMQIPNESTLRKNYVKPLFMEV